MSTDSTPDQAVDLNRQPNEEPRDWLGRIAIGYYRLLFATAFRIMRNNADAEDVVQQAIIKAIKRCDQLDESKAVVSWLVQITRNTALDLIRKQKRRANITDMQEIIMPAPDDDQAEYRMEDDIRELLLQVIDDMPEKQGQVIMMRHFHEMEVEDIAEHLSISVNNTRVRLCRAYDRLRGNPKVLKALGLSQKQS